MFPFIILFCIGMLNCFVNSKQSNFFLILFLLFFAGLRYRVGFDYDSYLKIMVDNDDFSMNRMEGLEYLLIKFCGTYKLYQFFFIINSAITIVCISAFINRFSSNVSVSIFVFITCPLLFTQSFSIIRHWTSVSIILYGTIFLYEKKLLKFLLCIIIAYFCHGVALFGLLYIPLFYNRLNRLQNVCLLFTSLVLGTLVQNVLISVFGGFESSSSAGRVLEYAKIVGGEDGMSKLPYIFLFFDLLFLLLYSNKMPNSKKLWITIYNISICVLFLFKFQTTLALRFSTVMLPAIVLCIPYLIGDKATDKTLWRYILTFIFFGILYFINLSIFNTALGRSQYLPYELFI